MVYEKQNCTAGETAGTEEKRKEWEKTAQAWRHTAYAPGESGVGKAAERGYPAYARYQAVQRQL